MSHRFPHYPGQRYARLVVVDEAGIIKKQRHLLCQSIALPVPSWHEDGAPILAEEKQTGFPGSGEE